MTEKDYKIFSAKIETFKALVRKADILKELLKCSALLTKECKSVVCYWQDDRDKTIVSTNISVSKEFITGYLSCVKKELEYTEKQIKDI